MLDSTAVADLVAGINVCKESQYESSEVAVFVYVLWVQCAS